MAPPCLLLDVNALGKQPVVRKQTVGEVRLPSAQTELTAASANCQRNGTGLLSPPEMRPTVADGG